MCSNHRQVHGVGEGWPLPSKRLRGPLNLPQAFFRTSAPGNGLKRIVMAMQVIDNCSHS